MSRLRTSDRDALMEIVDEQVAHRDYGTSSEYVRALIREDADRRQLRCLLLEGVSSVPAAPADTAYFSALRKRARRLARR